MIPHKYKTTLLASAFCLFFPFNTLAYDDASDCRPVRLDVPGEAMEFIPVKTQWLNLCAALAAVDLVDAWRFTHGATMHDFTSPIEAAIGYKMGKGYLPFSRRMKLGILEYLYGDQKRPYEWNLVDGLIHYLEQNGRCAAHSFTSDLNFDRNLADQLDIIADQFEKYKLGLPDNLTIGEETIERLKPLTPHLLLSREYEEIFKSSKKLLEVFFQIYSKRCPTREPLQLPSLKLSILKTEKELKDLLVKTFDQANGPKQPVVVDYCASLLLRGESYSGIAYQTGSLRLPSLSCGPHTSLIIGRRYDSVKNRCEVLIRNSWGEMKYHPDYDGSTSGSVWMPMTALVKNSFHFYSWDTPPRSE